LIVIVKIKKVNISLQTLAVNQKISFTKIDYLRVIKMKESIQTRLGDFLTLCKSHIVKNIYVFGSAVTENFNDESSDIDLLIEIDNDNPIERGENLMDIWDKLEVFFQRKVDLVTISSIKNPILRKNIDTTKILLYDGKEHKVAALMS
jgi:predicted nucleotidyltransferase